MAFELVRCKHCGADRAYHDGIERLRCETCGNRMTVENTKIILRESKGAADPLEGM